MNIFQLSLSILKIINIVLPPPAPGPLLINCLTDTTSTTLESLVACFDKYTVPGEYYTQDTYDAAQPNPEERAAWSDAVTSLLSSDVDNTNCASLTIPPALQDIYSFGLFRESDQHGSEYCILYETTSVDGIYMRGWGLVAVPTGGAAKRDIHISAPHPFDDRYTAQQAVAMFKGTGAKSLLISGRGRFAFKESTDCIIPAPGSGPYYKTDPAHDKAEPFFDAAKAIWLWQNAHAGCPSASCAFIQFHGKGASTCETDNIFMSSGLGSSPSSIAWYIDSTDRPIKRLQAQLQLAFPSWSISLPSDSACVLTATTNVVGRLINQITEENVCVKGATARIATGSFVHIEQDARSRATESYERWVTAINASFEVVS